MSGSVTTTIGAGPLTPYAQQRRTPLGRYGFNMGSGVDIFIDPDTAKQWIDVLTPISKENN